MRRLLVVEDEKMIRKGICTIAKRSGVPIEEILECSNGEDALELIKTTEIDVVFTDIRMPKMDGIELVQKVSQLEQKPFMVAISGYDDFSYAVEMLRNGVREYILKPVERDKIAEILQKLENEINEQRENEEIELELGKKQLRYLLTNEPISEEEITVLKNKYEGIFFEDYFVAVCTSGKVQIDKTPEIVEIKDIGAHSIFLMEQKELEAFLDRQGKSSCLGISDAWKGIEHLKDAYIQAVNARKVAFCKGENQLSICADSRIPQQLLESASLLLEDNEMHKRIQVIGTGKTDELLKYWDKLFSAVEKQLIKEEQFEAVQERFIEEMLRIYRASMSEEELQTLQGFRHMLVFVSLEDYKEQLMNWILQLHEKLNNEEDETVSDQKMKKALEYIHAHYTEDINMAVVSNYVSMNYSLFSFSFKQYTGTNFVSYFNELRLKKAKELLAETDEKVIDISQTVGYENEKHFMKLFKNTYGVSPSEYRKNMQRSK